MDNVTVEVNKAERDAIDQILRRLDGELDTYERNLLRELPGKIDQAREGH